MNLFVAQRDCLSTVKFKWCSARKLFFEFHAPLAWKRDQIAGSLSLGKGRATGKRHLRSTRGFHRAFVGTTPDLLEASIPLANIFARKSTAALLQEASEADGGGEIRPCLRSISFRLESAASSVPP